jgi:dihydroorotate dehydrogenase (fumarate)
MGLPNEGAPFYTAYSAAKKAAAKKPLVQSLFPESVAELDAMLAAIAREGGGVDLVEVNLSCPNLSGHPNLFVGAGLHALGSYLEVLRSHQMTIRAGLKLPPLWHEPEWDALCSLLLQYRDAVRFVTAINSLPSGLLVDAAAGTTLLHPRRGLGGIGGESCKAVGLANVYSLYRRIGGTIDIIGCGGIASATDVLEYILCGASAVQIGTHLLQEGPAVFERILAELPAQLRGRTVQQLRGTIRVRAPSPHTSKEPATSPDPVNNTHRHPFLRSAL